MADENTQAPQNPVSETQPIETQQASNAQAADEVKDAWKSVVGDKYKSPEELAKAYKDLESKLGQQSEDVRKSKEFQEVVRPILEEIRKDPKIFEALDKRLRNQEPDNTQPNDTANKIDEPREAVADMIRLNFEKKYGIDRLSPEDAADARKKIGEAIVDSTGKSFNQIDLRQLERVLDNAYLIANKDKLVRKEALDEATGSIPSVPSSPGTSVETLSPEEAKVAESLGLTRDQYISGKKSK